MATRKGAMVDTINIKPIPYIFQVCNECLQSSGIVREYDNLARKHTVKTVLDLPFCACSVPTSVTPTSWRWQASALAPATEASFCGTMLPPPTPPPLTSPPCPTTTSPSKSMCWTTTTCQGWAFSQYFLSLCARGDVIGLAKPSLALVDDSAGFVKIVSTICPCSLA